MEDAEPMKVFVLGNYHQAVLLCARPDRAIGSPRQTPITDVGGIGKYVRELSDETSRKIFVEQEPCLLSQLECSRHGARARQRTPGRRGCHRSSAAENRRGSVPRACRTQDMTG